MSQAGWVIKTEQAARPRPGSGWYGSAIPMCTRVYARVSVTPGLRPGPT